MKPIIFNLLGLLLLISVGCENNGVTISLTKDAMAQIAEQVDVLIADKSCGGANDCTSIAWGVDACGNFKSYLAYSPSKVDEAVLERLADHYNQLDRELNQLTEAEITTDCDVLLIEPLLDCLDQVCESQGDRYVVIN